MSDETLSREGLIRLQAQRNYDNRRATGAEGDIRSDWELATWTVDHERDYAWHQKEALSCEDIAEKISLAVRTSIAGMKGLWVREVVAETELPTRDELQSTALWVATLAGKDKLVIPETVRTVGDLITAFQAAAKP